MFPTPATLGNGSTLVYRDVRRLGTISLLDEVAWKAYTARIGPEPLTREFTSDRFIEQMLGTKQAIKKAIMDQRRVAGVGNIYANEALFRAGIDPSRRTDLLSSGETAVVHDQRARHARLYDHSLAAGQENDHVFGTTGDILDAIVSEHA